MGQSWGFGDVLAGFGHLGTRMDGSRAFPGCGHVRVFAYQSCIGEMVFHLRLLPRPLRAVFGIRRMPPELREDCEEQQVAQLG